MPDDRQRSDIDEPDDRQGLYRLSMTVVQSVGIGQFSTQRANCPHSMGKGIEVSGHALHVCSNLRLLDMGIVPLGMQREIELIPQDHVIESATRVTVLIPDPPKSLCFVMNTKSSIPRLRSVRAAKMAFPPDPTIMNFVFFSDLHAEPQLLSDRCRFCCHLRRPAQPSTRNATRPRFWISVRTCIAADRFGAAVIPPAITISPGFKASPASSTIRAAAAAAGERVG